MKIVTRGPYAFPGYCECTAPATAGSITLPTITIPSGRHPSIQLPYPVFEALNAEVQISVESEGDEAQSFTAPGLSQGSHRWVYEWRFAGINF